jgi:hypothetical protein
MVMQNLVFGILYGLVGQILSFTQLQVGIRYGWNTKHQWALLLLSIPISWIFLRSIENLIAAFDGELWPQRLIGFGLGIIVFSLMSWLLFGEQLTPKTIVSLILGVIIVAIQVLWR